MLPKSLQQLVAMCMKLPGVGQRTAMRYALALVRDRALAKELVDSITGTFAQVKLCTRCRNLAEGPRCDICQNPKRDQGVICIVAEVPDLITVEATHEYQGLYHVLGGLLDPITDVRPESLGIELLMERVRQRSDVRELILALNPTIEGEATMLHIFRRIKEDPHLKDRIKVTRLARGLPVGSELAYADSVTLSDALVSRQPLVKNGN